VDWAAVKVVVVASPGFVKDDWLRWALARPDARPIADARAKLVPAHCASGHARALAAVFADPAVAGRLAGTRAAEEVAALAALFDALRADDDRAFYGYRHVRLAADRAAVARLLLSDALFRHAPPDVRRDYVALADAVAAAGGEVLIFSSMHGAGEQLSQMTGVAALCRFPVPDAEEASEAHAARAAAHARAGRAAASGGGGGGGRGGGGGSGGGGGGGGGDDDDDGDEPAGDGDEPAGEGGAAAARFLGAAAFNAGLFDSDASSDSDASYKQAR
jgi:protein pelota